MDLDLLVEGGRLAELAVVDLDLDVADRRVRIIEDVVVHQRAHAGRSERDLSLVDLDLEGARIVEPGRLVLVGRQQLAAQPAYLHHRPRIDAEVNALHLDADRAARARLARMRRTGDRMGCISVTAPAA